LYNRQPPDDGLIEAGRISRREQKILPITLVAKQFAA